MRFARRSRPALLGVALALTGAACSSQPMAEVDQRYDEPRFKIAASGKILSTSLIDGQVVDLNDPEVAARVLEAALAGSLEIRHVGENERVRLLGEAYRYRWATREFSFGDEKQDADSGGSR